MTLTEVAHKINAHVNRRPFTMRRSVFISYAKADEATAAHLSSVLEEAGFAPWWSGQLCGGVAFRPAIVDALDASIAAVVIWSAASVRSAWVESEATHAFEQGKLVPVRFADLNGGKIPPPFGTLHTLPVDDHSGLIRAIRQLVVGRSAD